MCGERATDVDHVVNRASGQDKGLLQSLCSFHHRQKSSSEGVDARRELRERKRRQPDRHPGAL